MTDRDIPDRAERRKLLSVYGRNAVLEALMDKTIDCRALHLADSNRDGKPLRQIIAAAESRGLPVRYHSREALARISRNGRQDQGVAIDVRLAQTRDVSDYVDSLQTGVQRLIGLDGVSNPQNLGMVIRSVAAAGMDGMLLPDKGGPALGPLVIKASAGTVFRAPLLRCPTLSDGVRSLLAQGFTLYRLQAGGPHSLFESADFAERAVFVLGGESDGISTELQKLPGVDMHIPMANGVESLNVAVSAALVAYAGRQETRLGQTQRDR